MQLYDKYILPKLVHLACSRNPNMRQREKIIPLAAGRVLEIGVGSGLNLQFYNPDKVTRLWGLDPSMEMWRTAQSGTLASPIDFEHLQSSAEDIPLADETVDTVVMTYTLCTIPDPLKALREMGRVLVPHGKLLFCEHAKAPDRRVYNWQRWLNPIWKNIAGGCNLNRDISALITEGGFKITDLDTLYLPGWKPASYNVWGQAVKKSV
ncbi:MAG: class I SAM-dependent methyltransferase [FCB group bacterium]|nr:class I SAM-dependent methyltransferase [FCB group bacterium]